GDDDQHIDAATIFGSALVSNCSPLELVRLGQDEPVEQLQLRVTSKRTDAVLILERALNVLGLTPATFTASARPTRESLHREVTQPVSLRARLVGILRQVVGAGFDAASLEIDDWREDGLKDRPINGLVCRPIKQRDVCPLKRDRERLSNMTVDV